MFQILKNKNNKGNHAEPSCSTAIVNIAENKERERDLSIALEPGWFGFSSWNIDFQKILKNKNCRFYFGHPSPTPQIGNVQKVVILTCL